MLEYVGQPCICCGELFTEQDDIETCPDCGTPYHRACWKQHGKCINTKLHMDGQSWIKQYREDEKERKAQERREEEALQAAARESGEAPQLNPELYDGIRLRPDDPCLGLDPEENLDGISVSEAADFIRTNRLYYLPLFRLMKRTGKKLSFNFLSLLCPQYYFANRKMWGSAMAALLLNSLLEIPTVILLFHKKMDLTISWADVDSLPFRVCYITAFVLHLLLSVYWCVHANHMYYRFAQRRIKSIRQNAVSPEDAKQKTQTAGGTSLLNVLLMVGMQFMLTQFTGFMLMMFR